MNDKKPTTYQKFLFGYGMGMVAVTGISSAYLPHHRPFPLAAMSNLGIFAYDLLELSPIWYESGLQLRDIATGKAKVKEGKELQYWGDKLRIAGISAAVIGINIVSALRLFFFPNSAPLLLSLEGMLCFNRGTKLLYSSFVPKTGEQLLLVKQGDKYVSTDPEGDKKSIEIANKPYTVQDHLINGYNMLIASTGIAFTALSSVSAFALWQISSPFLAGMLNLYNLSVTIKLCLIPTIKEFQELRKGTLEVDNLAGYVGEKMLDMLAIAASVAAVPLSIIAPISASAAAMTAYLAATTSTTKTILAVKNYPHPPGTISMYTKMSGDGASNIFQRYEDNFPYSKYLKKKSWVEKVTEDNKKESFVLV